MSVHERLPCLFDAGGGGGSVGWDSMQQVCEGAALGVR